MSVDPAQLDELFEIALTESDEMARTALIDRACSGNDDLRERVTALLAAHDAAGSFLQFPAEESTDQFVHLSERPGSTIGRYRLLEQIGEGGFGVVFMAEQEQPVRRRVALKVIKLGMDTKQVVARFEAERQALAMMDHPNIAKVFDAGATDAGRPYFVMELVRGMPITEYCDQARLSTNERLALFQSVCAAVQHAHQKGIIHRDLKPSNVLVTLHDDKAVPKVIDFGVAKATQARLTERTLFTEFRQMIGTPSYMSPEQASMSGLDVDTRSDVYSLGVLLYELLTGTTPIDAKQLGSSSYDDLRRLICDVEPPLPSARLSTMTDEALTMLAQRRESEPTQLAVHLRSDLDWIVMRCLEKDRSRRYESASALARDLQRYLDGQSIEARPHTRRYRLGKFVHRYKVAVIAGTVIVAALVTGLALASVGLVQARRQAAIAKAESARSEQVAKFLTDMLSAVRPGVARGRDTTLLREVLDKTAERVESDIKDQPEVQGDLWSTLADSYFALDDLQQAERSYEKEIACYRSANVQNKSKLAMSFGDLGKVQTLLGETQLGRQNAELGLSIARSLGEAETLIHCLEMASRTQGEANNSSSKASILYLEEAIALRQQQQNNQVALSDLRGLLAIQFTAHADSDRGLKLANEALQCYRQLLPADDERISRCLYYLGQIYAHRGQHDNAVAHLREAVEIDRNIYPLHHSGVINPIWTFSVSLAKVGRQDEAATILREIAEESRRTLGRNNPATLRHLSNLVSLLVDIGEYEEGLQLVDDAILLSRDLYGPRHKLLLNLIWQKAQLLRGLDKLPESQEFHDEALKVASDLYGPDDDFTIFVAHDLAYLKRLQGEYADSLKILDQSIASLLRTNPRSMRLPSLRATKVIMHGEVGDFDTAKECVNDALNALPATDWQNRHQIAWILATSKHAELRDGPRAVKLAMSAVELSKFKEAGPLDTLAAAYAETSNFDAAIKWEQQAIELAPDQDKYKRRMVSYRDQRRWWVESESAWTLATSPDATKRNGNRALEFALIDAESTKYKNAAKLDALAAAYAETGDFQSAVQWQEQARAIAREDQLAPFSLRLDSYRNNKPWRTPK